MYRCKTCEKHATAILCRECFTMSEHRHHDFKVEFRFRTLMLRIFFFLQELKAKRRGICHCGLKESFKRDRLCLSHKNELQNMIESRAGCELGKSGKVNRTHTFELDNKQMQLVKKKECEFDRKSVYSKHFSRRKYSLCYVFGLSNVWLRISYWFPPLYQSPVLRNQWASNPDQSGRRSDDQPGQASRGAHGQPLRRNHQE